jgi:predicted transcriptional regulator
MQVEQPKETAKPKPKGLSNTHKKKARDMYESGADADEIAEELGKEKTLVIDYLKKLEDA